MEAEPEEEASGRERKNTRRAKIERERVLSLSL